ncbi:hypothetical protein Anapl_03268 [Anas platyrhynchos]|uniref:Uncharacterized protein n=1 Tax=Anas platyrhynchos TaxID=8839 RepID=R0K4Y4_ANAPL|nr:hypothetical protein Anapl_03268 [Anas platyrhynchos]
MFGYQQPSTSALDSPRTGLHPHKEGIHQNKRGITSKQTEPKEVKTCCSPGVSPTGSECCATEHALPASSSWHLCFAPLNKTGHSFVTSFYEQHRMCTPDSRHYQQPAKNRNNLGIIKGYPPQMVTDVLETLENSSQTTYRGRAGQADLCMRPSSLSTQLSGSKREAFYCQLQASPARPRAQPWPLLPSFTRRASLTPHSPDNGAVGAP